MASLLNPPKDLKHRDWLLKSQQSLILSIAPNVSTSIISTPDGGKRLLVTHISQKDIGNLKFLTNTDNNNNYLYLENITVTLGGNISSAFFPGFTEILIKIFESSDMNAFINGARMHQPFISNNINGMTIVQFTDLLSQLLPMVQDTTGVDRYYNLTLNPDEELEEPDKINNDASVGGAAKT